MASNKLWLCRSIYPGYVQVRHTEHDVTILSKAALWLNHRSLSKLFHLSVRVAFFFIFNLLTGPKLTLNWNSFCLLSGFCSWHHMNFKLNFQGLAGTHDIDFKLICITFHILTFYSLTAFILYSVLYLFLLNSRFSYQEDEKMILVYFNSELKLWITIKALCYQIVAAELTFWIM